MNKQRKYNYRKLPLYMQVAFDLYMDHMSIDDVANKYSRSRRQIQWLLSKSIRPHLPNLWEQIMKRLHNKNVKNIPIYAEIAIDMCRNRLNVLDCMKKYNRSRKQINESLQRTSKQLPVVYNFINENVIRQENKILLKTYQ